jgi:predicted dehydrogenase
VVLTRPKAVRRVLVAGTGSIGRRHVRNLQSLRPDLSFAFLRDDAREDDYSRGLGARVFARLADALEWQPDLGVVATPSNRHHEIVAPLLRHGVASLIEKPVVIDKAHLDELLLLASHAPPTQIGCVLRFLPSLQEVHTWLRDGAIGTVARASLEVGQWLPDWRPAQDYRESYSASVARGGGVVLDLVHEIDLACWLFNADRVLGAWGGHRSSLDIEAEDVALLALRGHKGLPVAVQLDYVSRLPVRRLLAVGDRGNVHWDLPSRRCVLQRPGQPDVEAEGFDTAQAYVHATDELLAAVELGLPTSLPLLDGLRATRLAVEANSIIRQTAALT